MDIRISTSKIIRFLFTLLIVIFVGSICVHIIGLRTGHWRLGGLFTLFSLDGENTVPTWYNSFILFLLSMTAWAISKVAAAKKTQQEGRWKFLGFLFLVMSIDEVAMFHETIGKEIATRFHTESWLYFGFVIPGFILALILLVIYIPFLKSLPQKTMWGLVTAGAIYVGGAAGVEAIEARWFYLYGERNIVYLLLSNFEELCEMGGLILFLKVLLDYLKYHSDDGGSELRLRLEP